MHKLTQNPEQTERTSIDPGEALRLYEEGVRRLRKPKPRIAGNGLDTNSYDFRGVRAAMDVVSTFPHETDADGHRVQFDTDAVKTHMDLGLTTITEAGNRPLAGDFFAGYQRMAEAFSENAERLVALGNDSSVSEYQKWVARWTGSSQTYKGPTYDQLAEPLRYFVEATEEKVDEVLDNSSRETRIEAAAKRYELGYYAALILQKWSRAIAVRP